MPRHKYIANAKIVVLNRDMEEGYKAGYSRYEADYPDNFPTDRSIADFMEQRTFDPNTTSRYQGGFVLGWCAALLTRCMYVSLPVRKVAGRKPISGERAY